MPKNMNNVIVENAEELLKICNDNNINIYDVILENEYHLLSKSQLYPFRSF